jgi:hypothetical protein
MEIIFVKNHRRIATTKFEGYCSSPSKFHVVKGLVNTVVHFVRLIQSETSNFNVCLFFCGNCKNLHKNLQSAVTVRNFSYKSIS